MPKALYLYGMSLPDKADGANWLRRAAEKGHAARDDAKSRSGRPTGGQRRWFEAAAKAGDPEGMYRFGLLTGDREWLGKAAGKDHAPAMVALGDAKWLEKAAAAGYANAFTKWGSWNARPRWATPKRRCCSEMACAPKKPRQAYALYVEAAKAGYVPAMTRLGDCSLNGQGTSRSEIDALKWYREALANGDATAEARLKFLWVSRDNGVVVITRRHAVLLVVAAPLAAAGKTVKIAYFDRAGRPTGVQVVEKITKTDAEWQKQLTPEQFHVTRQKGTERAGTGKYAKSHDEGTYTCVCCGTPLFASETKFESGTGWPSFYQPIAKQNVDVVVTDRTE